MGFAVTSYAGETPVVGLVSASSNSQRELLALPSNDTTLGTNKNRYELFLQPCVAIDNTVLSILNPINSSKTDIVSNGNSTVFEAHPKYYSTPSTAINAATTLYNGTLSTVQAANNLNFIGINVKTATNFSVGAVVSSSTGGSGTVSIQNTSQIGNPFNVIVQDVTGSFGVGATVYLAGIAFTTLGSLDYVGSGRLYNDNVIITYYPDLEPANTSVENPFVDLQLKILSNSTKGIGVANTFYPNSLENASNPNGDFVDSDDSINPIGRVYAFDTASGSSQNNNISNLITSISNNRSGIASYNAASTLIKGRKKGYSVNIWSLEKSDAEAQLSIDANDALIIALENPANGGPY